MRAPGKQACIHEPQGLSCHDVRVLLQVLEPVNNQKYGFNTVKIGFTTFETCNAESKKIGVKIITLQNRVVDREVKICKMQNRVVDR